LGSLDLRTFDDAFDHPAATIEQSRDVRKLKVLARAQRFTYIDPISSSFGDDIKKATLIACFINIG
jgi:hypothetical protein